MAETDDRVTVICVPRHLIAQPSFESRIERCCRCDGEVWVDVKIPHDDCVCIRCFDVEAASTPGGMDFEIHPATRETLRSQGWTDERIDRQAKWMRLLQTAPRRQG
jgi:hypothetical protein